MIFRSTKPSQTLSLNELMQDLEASGQTIYKFGFGQSPFLPPTRVQEALQESANRIEYAPVQGMRELRQKIAEFHTRVEKIETHPDQIVVASGSKILLLNSLFAFQDALVLLPSPSWVSYEAQAQLIGHTVYTIPTTFDKRWHIQADQLDKHLSELNVTQTSKVLVLNYPGNPDGLTYNEAELQALAEVLRKHEVWVIADEIYGMLHHQGHHVSLRQYYPERTMVTTGLSKWCGAGGWRLGVQILPQDAPPELLSAILSLASSTYSCAPTPIQLAATQAYTWDSDTAQFLSQQQNILRVMGQTIYKAIAKSGVAVQPPEGAFYLLLDFSPLREQLREKNITTDSQLCEQLLANTGVALLPGSAFGMAEDDLATRLAYVDFNGNATINSLKNADSADIESIVLEKSAHMLDGIQKMVDWLG